MMYRGIPPSVDPPFFYWGIAELGLNTDFQTNDSKTILRDFRGSGVTCVYLPYYGAVTPFADAVGLAVHEVGHYLFGGGHIIYNFATLGAMSRQNGGSSFCSLERRWLGWIDFDYVDAEPTVLTLHDFFTTGEAGAVRIGSTGNRWFIIENRQKIDPLDKAKHPGIYVYYFGGVYDFGLDISTADGRWNWTINPSTQQPEQISANPSTGTSKLQLYLGKPPPGYNGDNLDPFNVGYKTVLQPNINPSSYTRDGNLTNIAIQLIGTSEGVTTLKVYKNAVSGSVSGTISQNTTWAGNISVTGTTTLNSGYTLTILPGTTISFASGTSLQCNGQLIADGTSTERITFSSVSGTDPGSWGSITLSGSGASNSSISHAQILYGTEIAIVNNASNVTIQNSTITDVKKGVRFNGSSGSVLNNQITSSTVYYGITAENGSTVTCNENVLIKQTPNYQSGAAILYAYGSGGTIWKNDISGWNWGVGAIWGSSPHFMDTSNAWVNNRIDSCKYGVRATNSSWPVICPDLAYEFYCYAGNSIHNNSPYNLFFASGGTLWATLTYWGGTPPINFYTLYGSTINYDYWLTSDPWEGEGSQSLAMTEPSSLTPSDLASSQVDVPGEASLFDGVALRLAGEYVEAVDFFKSYLSKNPGDQAAYVELYNCYSKETADDLLSYFTSLPQEASRDHGLLLGYLYLRQGDSRMARQVNDELIKSYPTTALASRAKLNNAYLSLYADNDVATAASLLNEVASRPELTTEIELSLVQQAIDAQTAVLGGARSDGQEAVGPKVMQPTETELLQNYPNPFNPATVIKYSVSEPQLVTLRVYDLLGRQISVLANEMKQPGNYTVSFDASRLPTGIYFYHLTAGKQSIVKRMSVVK